MTSDQVGQFVREGYNLQTKISNKTVRLFAKKGSDSLRRYSKKVNRYEAFSKNKSEYKYTLDKAEARFFCQIYLNK